MNRKSFLTTLAVGSLGMLIPPDAFSMPVEMPNSVGMTEDPILTPEAPKIESYGSMGASLPVLHGRSHPRFRWTFPVGVYSAFQNVENGEFRDTRFSLVSEIRSRSLETLRRGIVARMWYAYKHDPIVRDHWNNYCEDLRRGTDVQPPYQLLELGNQSWEFTELSTLFGFRVALVETSYAEVDTSRSSLYLQTVALPHDTNYFEMVRNTYDPTNPGASTTLEHIQFSRLMMSGVKFLSFDANEEVSEGLPYQDFSNLGWIGDQLTEMQMGRVMWQKSRKPFSVWSTYETMPLIPEFLIDRVLTLPT